MEAERWLKWKLGTRVDACVNPSDNFRGDSWEEAGIGRAVGDRRVIAFLEAIRERRTAPVNTPLGVLQQSCRWYVQEQSPGYSRPSIVAWSAEREREVRRAVLRQTPGSLAGAAGRIVLARTRPGYHPHFDAHRFQVLRVFKGPEADSSLVVDLVVPWGEWKAGPFFCFLRTGPTGNLEPVELHGGIVEVRGDRVPAWGLGLAEAESLIVRLVHSR